MFTGLIEAVGHVSRRDDGDGALRLAVRAPFAVSLSTGESVSVNGVCLTVAAVDGEDMHADIGPETARITTLGALRPGDSVNLERAMRADARFGGHVVQGHVDGIGTVEDVRTDREAHWLTISYPQPLAAFFVAKGSVAVDGISLTVAALADGRFDVMIIPFTWANTNLAAAKAGARVNLECDVIGKYVARAVRVFGIRD